MMRVFGVWVLAGLLTAAAQGLPRICGSCGREDTTGASHCRHCQAGLPEAPDAKPAAPPESGAAAASGSRDAALFEAARADVQAARGEAARRPAVALALFDNARALLAAADPASLPAETGETLLAEIQPCRAALAGTQQRCPACSGSGRRQIRIARLADTRADEAPATREMGQACPACGGRGVIPGSRDVEAVRLLILQGRREAGLMLQTAGRVAAGRAWIPSAWPRERTPAQLAAIRKTLAASCPSCAGLGVMTCRKCAGTGRQPCANRQCRDGWIEQETGNTLSPRTALTRRVRCPFCEGTGRTDCQTCRGQGCVACGDCRGTGLAAPCRACGGEGVAPCRACRSRRRRGDAEPCAVCRDTGQMTCGRCQGDGYTVK